MTEQEYINVRNLVRVTSMREAIKDMLPADGVPRDEFETVAATLSKWQQAIFKALSPDDEGNDE